MSAQGAQAPATLCASQTADVMAPGPFTRMACQGFHLLRPMPGLPWPALDAATQANLWPTKSAITSMPARDADVMAPAFHLGGCRSKALLLPTTYCPDGVQNAQPSSTPDDRMIRPRAWYTGSSSWISRIVAVPPSRVGYVFPTSICMLLSLVENHSRLVEWAVVLPFVGMACGHLRNGNSRFAPAAPLAGALLISIKALPAPGVGAGWG